MYASATVTGTGKDFNDINASKSVFAKLGDDQKHFWRKQALDSNRHANILQKVALDSSVESFRGRRQTVWRRCLGFGR